MKTNQLSARNPRKRNRKFSFLTGLLLFIASIQAHSQLLGNWDFSNTLVGTNGLYNLISPASFSPLITTRAFKSGTEYFGENNWPGGGINTAAYMEFSLWPTLGYQLNMTSITIKMRRSNTGSPAGSGPTAWSVRSSLDLFASNIASGTMDHNYANYTIPLPSTFLYLPLPIVFRVYGYNATVSSGGSSRMVFDNIGASGLTGVLPIKLTSFTATANADNVGLKFSMAQTEAGTKYIIEKSLDSRNFTGITIITEKSTIAASYTYSDRDLPPGKPKLYYRLKMISVDGAITYSSIILVNLDETAGTGKFKISTSGHTLYITGQFKPGYTIDLFNATGARVAHYYPATEAQSLVLNLSSTLPAGNYVAVVNATGRRESSVVVIR